MVSKLCDAATLGSNIRDFECAAFCALRFKAFVEFAAICDNWLAKEEAMVNVVKELTEDKTLEIPSALRTLYRIGLETFFLSRTLKLLSARLTFATISQSGVVLQGATSSMFSFFYHSDCAAKTESPSIEGCLR